MSETETARGRQQRTVWSVILVVTFLLGALPVALELSVGHALFGVTEYDDGVYFAAALRLIHGVLPYRDFVFVQPPGIAIVLAPVAALGHLVGGRDALALARMLTAVVAGANAALVAFLLRRHGGLAMAVGGVAMAVDPTNYVADHTFLLEPYCVLFVLGGLACLFERGAFAGPRRCAVGGALLAFACVVKSFAIVPLVLVALVVLATNRRRFGWYALGVGVVVVVAALPFLVAAPSAFFHDVVSSQATRATQSPTSLLNRLFALTGLAYASPTLSAGQAFPAVAGGSLPTALASAGIGATWLWVTVRLLRRRTSGPFEWFIVTMAVLAVAMAFVPAAYYDHYAYFTAPFLALVLGDGGCALILLNRRVFAGRPDGGRRAIRVTGGVWIALLVAGIVGALVPAAAYQRTIVGKFGDPGPAIAAAIPAGACVVTDAESALVSAGRADVGPAGCPAIVDATGTWLSIDPGHPPGPRQLHPHDDPRLVAIWARIFGESRYVVFGSGPKAFRIPWTPALRREFNARFVPVAGRLVFRARS